MTKSDLPSTPTLGFLERRRIEANIIAPIYEVMKRELGQERAAEIIREAIAVDARKSGAEFAAQTTGGPSLAAFIGIQELWTKDDALITTTREESATVFAFDVTSCAYSRMYSEMGLSEIGGLLSCVRDAEFIAGYDPTMTMTRTQTLMQGASHCDFRYVTREV